MLDGLRKWVVRGLPVLGWLAIVVAAALDPGHDLVAHYVSWLSDGPYSWLAGLGVLALSAAAALAGWRLALPPPWHSVARTGLVFAALLGVGTLLWPSRGFEEPLARTALHVGMAVGAYSGFTIAVGAQAWCRRSWGWFVAVMVALTGVLLVAAAVRLWDADTQWRGLAQLLLAGVAAAWLATR